MAFLGMGGEELMVILVIVLLLFGATAIPKLARSLGRARGEFSKAKKEFDDELRKSESESAAAPSRPSEDALRKSARDLGIDEAGKSVDEVKRLIQAKLA